MSRSPDSESDADRTPQPSSTSMSDTDAQKGPTSSLSYRPYPIIVPTIPRAIECRRGASPSPSHQPTPASTSSGAADSKQLKFGMERILSEEVRPAKRPQLQDAAVVPCSECVSSLLRCCRLNAPGCEAPQNFCSPYPPPGGYYSTLHTPRPVRPYTNMLASDGVHVTSSDRGPPSSSSGANKRKRSWSRAVFSNLQRKGLEKRFQLQKYITKPDRRQLAATLGLTDAQVKVWFQNRRMKWRHSKETKLQQTGSGTNEGRSTKEDQGGPDSSTQDQPEIDVQTVDS